MSLFILIDTKSELENMADYNRVLYKSSGCKTSIKINEFMS